MPLGQTLDQASSESMQRSEGCACLQARPGRILTVLLATAGLAGVGLGSTACLTLLLAWLFVSAAPTGQPGSKSMADAGLDDALSSEDLGSNPDLDAGGALFCINVTHCKHSWGSLANFTHT